MDKVLPPPRHFYTSHCNTCGVNSQLFVNFQPAINAGRRHKCDAKKITIFNHIYYWDQDMPTKRIFMEVQ